MLKQDLNRLVAKAARMHVKLRESRRPKTVVAKAAPMKYIHGFMVLRDEIASSEILDECYGDDG